MNKLIKHLIRIKYKLLFFFPRYFLSWWKLSLFVLYFLSPLLFVGTQSNIDITLSNI